MKAQFSVISAFLLISLFMVGCVPEPAVAPATPTSALSKTSSKTVVENVIPSVVQVIAQREMGSGMIIDKTGYIFTNAHVIANSLVTTVILSDGREVPASIVGVDETKDLALLKIDIGELPAITLGNSSDLKAGDAVIAIGFPLALQGGVTVSRGIVSAIRTDSKIGVTYIQTDAAMNPGNSGGPLINLVGEVVGINASGIRVAGGQPIQGMNFSIAIDDAKLVMTDLKAGKVVKQPVPTTTATKDYINDIYGYSVSIPPSWDVNVIALDYVVLSSRTQSASFSIKPDSNVSNYSTESYAQLWIEIGRLGLTDYRQISKGKIIISGSVEAYEIDEEWRRPNSDYWEKGREVFFVVNGIGYKLYAESKRDEYSLYDSTFIHLITSFTLTNSIPPLPKLTPTPTPSPVPAPPPITPTPWYPTPTPTSSPTPITKKPVVADFVGNPTSGTPTLGVRFTDLSTGNITSWVWEFGDGGISHDRYPPIHFYFYTGTYTVSLKVTGPNGSDTKVMYHYINVTAIQYTLTTNVRVAGGVTEDCGKIVISPSRVQYDFGTQVKLTAIPAYGYEFDRWSGDVSSRESTITISIDSNKILFANFVKISP